MKSVAGASSLRRSLRNTELVEGLTVQGLLLLGVGVLAVVLHSVLDRDLGLPGHHGLEWMALLVAARQTSRFRWAATVASVGAAAVSPLPLMGFGDPFIALVFLLPGPIIDVSYRLAGNLQDKLWFLALLGGLAHASKPVVRLAISTILGWPYGSLLYGFGYPLVSHIFWGVLGASIGVAAIRLARRR